MWLLRVIVGAAAFGLLTLGLLAATAEDGHTRKKTGPPAPGIVLYTSDEGPPANLDSVPSSAKTGGTSPLMPPSPPLPDPEAAFYRALPPPPPPTASGSSFESRDGATERLEVASTSASQKFRPRGLVATAANKGVEAPASSCAFNDVQCHRKRVKDMLEMSAKYRKRNKLYAARQNEQRKEFARRAATNLSAVTLPSDAATIGQAQARHWISELRRARKTAEKKEKKQVEAQAQAQAEVEAKAEAEAEAELEHPPPPLQSEPPPDPDTDAI